MTGDKAMTATPIHDSSVETFSGALTRQAPTKRSSLARLCDDAIGPPRRAAPRAAGHRPPRQPQSYSWANLKKPSKYYIEKYIVKMTHYSYA